MKESVAIAKETDTKKEFSPTETDNSIHHVQNEPERQLGSLRSVINTIRSDGGTPSVESIATELSSMHNAERAPVLLALQRTHGNRYVQRVVTGIQAKLKVGQLGDIYEQEADRVAGVVMRMSELQVQRQSEEEEKKEEESIQTKPLSVQITPLVQRQVEGEEEKEEILQTKEVPSLTPEVTPDIESRINALRGSGQPLPKSVRDFFEPRFGYDFSQVRVHTDKRASESARAVNARAFTVRRDVVFGVGQYVPGSMEGEKLIAHELTHVVQQGSAPPLSDKLTVSKPLEGYENEAGAATRDLTSRLSVGICGAITALQRKDKGQVKGGSRTIFPPVKYKSYPVKATTLKGAVEAMKKARGEEAGETEWEPKLDYSFDKETGIIKSANVIVPIVVTMPKWPGAKKLGKAAKAEWERFDEALKDHEEGHVKLVREKLKDLDKSLVGKSREDAETAFQEALDALQKASDAYDARTDHGRKQGTIIDTSKE